MTRPWIVLKYGGTSVSDPECWDRIADRIRRSRASHRVCVVASALSRVSDRLERAILESARGGHPASLDWIVERHRRHAAELELDAEGSREAERLLSDLEQLLEGVRLTGEAPPRLRARVLSFGELASTRLGLEALRRRGIEARWVDARALMTSTTVPGEPATTRFLEATVVPVRDPARVESSFDGPDVVLTQGFIARTPAGETCLLGRGGSDTSAALFAVLLDAAGLEIWSDVHGMFTADPRLIPTARLIRRIGYREAQELATMGAKVLHPRSLPPVAGAGIPVRLRNTFAPEADGTLISSEGTGEPAVMAVVCRTGATLLTLSTLSMWGKPGFLARAFEPFERFGLSVDLVATSQSAISVSLDPIAADGGREALDGVLGELERLGEVEVVEPCAVVSIVGRRIRTVLHELGPAMAVFREHRVHLVSESSEDLNLSFVVDEDDARPLIRDLHGRLFPPQGERPRGAPFGDTWEMLQSDRVRTEAPGERSEASVPGWWRGRRERLLSLVSDGRARFVYDLATVRDRAARLRRTVTSVDRWYYALKANDHPEVLRAVASAGFGFECVSAAEVSRVRDVLGADPSILFTPNFCPVDEYRRAIDAGAEVTLDGPHVLLRQPDLFRGREVALRIDPGAGLGHHDKVRTAGAQAKFGQPAGDAREVVDAAAAVGADIVGLHAHVGSGIFDAATWGRTGEALAELRAMFPAVRWIDVGGGLGVVERPGQEPLDLRALEGGLAVLKSSLPGVALRMEPGRYLVSEAGVLLAPVTQVRIKGNVRFAGVATGMNSLLRPALYGAWHAIHNLTRLDLPPEGYWHVVGPICESSDVLGRDRLLPPTEPGDVLLIENCGAYGAVMASRYNRREPAEEITLDGPAALGGQCDAGGMPGRGVRGG